MKYVVRCSLYTNRVFHDGHVIQNSFLSNLCLLLFSLCSGYKVSNIVEGDHLLLTCSDRERAAEGVKQKTVSLWSCINSHLDIYRNPLYWSPSTYQQVLVPIASVRHIILWKGHYCRWNPSMRPQVIHLYFVTLTAVSTNIAVSQEAMLRSLGALSLSFLYLYSYSVRSSLLFCPEDGGSRFLQNGKMMYQTAWDHIPQD